MAGSSPDFNAAEFRRSVHEVEQMGMPQDVALRPTFHFDLRPVAAAGVATDRRGRPFDWTEPVDPVASAPPKPPVQASCSWASASAGSNEDTAVGEFNANEYDLFILDDEWAKVADFTFVLLGGNEYRREFQVPEQGLYEVTIHQVRVTARDES